MKNRKKVRLNGCIESINLYEPIADFKVCKVILSVMKDGEPSHFNVEFYRKLAENAINDLKVGDNIRVIGTLVRDNCKTEHPYVGVVVTEYIKK